MNTLPLELVNKIIMMNRPTYSYMADLEEHINEWKENDDIYNFCEHVFISIYLMPLRDFLF